MKKLVVIGVALGLAFGLAGCSASQYPEKPRTEETATGTTAVETPEATTQYTSASVVETAHIISDGRTVTCLVLPGAYEGGISCDWANAK